MNERYYRAAFLPAIYCVAALLEAGFYFYGSPLYVLGFSNPLINYGALAMLAHALVFAGICTCLFIGRGGLALQRLFRVAALSFTALNLVPAIFYYNLRSGLRLAPVGIVLHLAPVGLLFLALFYAAVDDSSRG